MLLIPEIAVSAASNEIHFHSLYNCDVAKFGVLSDASSSIASKSVEIEESKTESVFDEPNQIGIFILTLSDVNMAFWNMLCWFNSFYMLLVIM